MRKFRVPIVLIFTVLMITFTACIAGGCDFVQYVKTEETPVVTDEVANLREDYVDKLYIAVSEIKFREKEQRLFELKLQDAVNELNECGSEEQLKSVLDKHLLAIGEIKTDGEYKSEEEAAAVNAYRVAVLKQADESFDKTKYHSEQITYLNSVFFAFSGNLYETTDRDEMNALLQEFYFNVHKEDEILALIDYADVSGYEDSLKEILEASLDGCINDIRACTEEEGISDVREIYEYQVYKCDTVKNIKTYADTALYRDEQVAEIENIMRRCLALAEQATTRAESDNAYREYQIAVYNIPTDAMLYSEELAAIKEELNASLSNAYKLSYYRENEGLIVRELLNLFQNQTKNLTKKEDVFSQYVLTKSRLEAVKTADEIKADERTNLIDELYGKLLYNINNHVDEVDRENYLVQSEQVYSAMCDRLSFESIRKIYRDFASELGVAEVLKEELEEYNDTVFYRENEKKQVNAIKEKYLPKFTDDLSMEMTKALLQEAKDEIDKIKTNDDLWNDSVTKFRADLRSLYGDAILEEPRSLTEANDYVELANIIDYYAFYQLSGTEFVCDTFRVKLNFDHNDATWERNEVYWYCELLKSAVDIQAEFEVDSDNLVFYLTGYNFATESNKNITEPNNKISNGIQFDSDKSNFTIRGAEFDAFPYYNYDKQVVVHNSQQLWYALEHEYVPICEQATSAETILNEAKKILREIIMEGMSDEEKIFQIYSWIGKNVQFDDNQGNHNTSSDPNNYPNEIISSLNSHFLEGGIFDRLTVCIGFSKIYLLFLRMEGIKAKINISRMPYMQGQNTINSISWSFHAFVYVNLNGKWYYSDSEKAEDRANGTNSIQYIMLPKDYGAVFDERMNADLAKGNDLNYYDNFVYNEKKTYVKNKYELFELLDIFEANLVTEPVSIFKGYENCLNDILEYATERNVNYNFLNRPELEIIIQRHII